MFDGKFIATLFAIAVSIFAICNFNTKKITSHEAFGFGNLPSTTWRKERVYASSQEAAERGDFYTVPPNYQSNISPRFSNVDYGANIRYNMPSQDHQASTCDPLTFGGMARENFTNGSKDTVELMEENTRGKYNELSGQSDQYLDVLDMVPVGDMTNPNALGENEQTIVYERFIHAGRRNRLRSQGCPLRGDVAPKHHHHCDKWFSVSANPSLDLRQGALSVMGGNNEASLELADLINTTSGHTAIGGIDMSSSKNMYTNQNMSTVQVRAFV